MASLARREDVAGKVQMIYMDPPYGIKFASNFQPEIGKRDVKDKEADLTREPEMVKAYRDTWTLGVHSYLAYLRDRLLLCKELLADTGSIFVQISDENLHRVRALMDEIIGGGNFIAVVCYKKPGQRDSEYLPTLTDFILWYARDREQMKFRRLYLPKSLTGGGGDHYTQVELANGSVRPITEEERTGQRPVPTGARILQTVSMTSEGSQSGSGSFKFQGEVFLPPPHKHWSASLPQGMERVAQSERLAAGGKTIRYKFYFDDMLYMNLDNRWNDIGLHGESIYVVRTAEKVVERCLLMTTDPGDLVLDPTCGGGTTASVAERWGRRWITIDTSRVAIAIARQRILTATYPFFKVKGAGGNNAPVNPSSGFICAKCAQVSRENIAQNAALDAIFTKHQTVLAEKLKALNAALAKVPKTTRDQLAAKLARKERDEGKKSVTDADRRRWILPPLTPNPSPTRGEGGWQEWEAPFDTDPDWPEPLKAALEAYRKAWRAKMDEVNACIAASAEPVDLVDQPEVAKNVVRVAGPFSVEAVLPVEESLIDQTPIGGAPDELPTYASTTGVSPVAAHERDARGTDGPEVRRSLPGQNAKAAEGGRCALPQQQGRHVHSPGIVPRRVYPRGRRMGIPGT